MHTPLLGFVVDFLNNKNNKSHSKLYNYLNMHHVADLLYCLSVTCCATNLQ